MVTLATLVFDIGCLLLRMQETETNLLKGREAEPAKTVT